MPQRPLAVQVEDITAAADAAPPLTLHIGSRPYELHCPKDAIWASVVASRATEATGPDQSRAMFLFLNAALGPEGATELQRRLGSAADTVDLIDLVHAYNECIGAWSDHVSRRFEALGLKFSADVEAHVVLGTPAAAQPQEQPSPANRAERRAARPAKPAAAVRKAPRATR